MLWVIENFDRRFNDLNVKKLDFVFVSIWLETFTTHSHSIDNDRVSEDVKKTAQQDWISFEAAFNASTNNRKIVKSSRKW